MKLLKRIKNWIKSLLSKADEIKDKYLSVAVHAVQVIKKAIENVTDNTAWAALTSGAWCVYENDTSYKCK